eukprot:1856914-Amphidinium_carterae.2
MQAVMRLVTNLSPVINPYLDIASFTTSSMAKSIQQLQVQPSIRNADPSRSALQAVRSISFQTAVSVRHCRMRNFKFKSDRCHRVGELWIIASWCCRFEMQQIHQTTNRPGTKSCVVESPTRQALQYGNP